MAKIKRFVEIPGIKTLTGSFSWKLAEIGERRAYFKSNGVSSTDVLAKIHKKFDSDHKKALARLKKSFA